MSNLQKEKISKANKGKKRTEETKLKISTSQIKRYDRIGRNIKSWAKYMELRYDINNGVTLCRECHKLTDNYKGRKNKKNE